MVESVWCRTIRPASVAVLPSPPITPRLRPFRAQEDSAELSTLGGAGGDLVSVQGSGGACLSIRGWSDARVPGMDSATLGQLNDVLGAIAPIVLIMAAIGAAVAGMLRRTGSAVALLVIAVTAVVVPLAVGIWWTFTLPPT